MFTEPEIVRLVLAPLTEESVRERYEAFGMEFGVRGAGVAFSIDRTGALRFECDLVDRGGGQSVLRLNGKQRLLLARVLTIRSLRASLGQGKVAFNEMTCLDPASQRKGVGRALLKFECDLFREWGGVELQLNVGCEARDTEVWQKLGFVPSLQQRRALESLWEDYCAENGVQFSPLPAAWQDMEETFRKECVRRSVEYLHLTRVL